MNDKKARLTVFLFSMIRCIIQGKYLGRAILLGPIFIYLSVFYLYPLFGVLIRSVFDPNFTIEHYTALLKYPVYMRILVNTLEISFLTASFCVILGYPIAYALCFVRSKWKILLLFSILLPFWISALVRTYSWMILLGRFGTVNRLLSATGLIDAPLSLMYNRFGVLVGLIYILLPFAIFPMENVMRGIDESLIRAAQSLGSSSFQIFRRIFFPLSLPGICAGFILTFVVSAGSFITPMLMGGPKDAMIATSIHAQLENVNNWGFAGVLSVILLAAVLLLFILFSRFFGLGFLVGHEKRKMYHNSGKNVGISKYTLHNALLRLKNMKWRGKCDVFLERVWYSSRRRLHTLLKPVSSRIPEFVRITNWGKMSLAVYCVGIFIFLILPVFIVVPIAFSDELFVRFPPAGYSLHLFESYFSSPGWMRATRNSFCVAVPVMFLATLLGTAASLSLVRGLYRGKRFLYAFFISPMVIPAIISAISMYFFISKLKMIGTVNGLILAHTVIAVPYVVVVMTSTLQGFDEQLEQASMSLGAGRIGTFFNITLPLIRPGIFTALIFSFIASFDEVIIALFISGVGAETIPKRMWDGIREEMSPVIAAVSAVLILVSAVLLLSFVILRRRQKRFSVRKQF
jgi:putative spermidine/putrescine transport system permease protein